MRVPAALASAASELLWNAGTIGIEERLPGGLPLPIRQPWETGPIPPPPAFLELLAWFELDGEEESRRLRLERELSALKAEITAAVDVREGDWPESWKDRFDTLWIAPDIVITPPWKPVPGAIVIEPGMAFGTGDHPTTRACLDAIARYGRTGGSLLDVGCGSGILALAAARRGMNATGVDIDPNAVRIATENARINKLSVAFSTTPLSLVKGSFDLVVANIFAEEIVRLAKDLRRVCKERLVVSGILVDRADLVREAMSGFMEDRTIIDGEWVTIEWIPHAT